MLRRWVGTSLRLSAVVGLVCDANLFPGFSDGLALCKQHTGFAELVNNLFGVVPLLRHGSDLLNWRFTTLDLNQEN